MDNTQKFTGKSDVYEQSRPAYAPALIDWLAQTLKLNQNSKIADVGAGTGKLTRPLLELGTTVYAVEPNVEMLAKAIALLSRYDGFHPVEAPAEHTTLPDKSIHLITAAQAFHWFDQKAFQKECERILVPGGYVCLIWNHRRYDDEVNRIFRKIFEKHCPNFLGFSIERQMNHMDMQKLFQGEVIEMCFDNPVAYDQAGFVGRALSASYALTPDDHGYEAFVADLRAFFDQNAMNGVIHVPHQSVAYLAQI